MNRRWLSLFKTAVVVLILWWSFAGLEGSGRDLPYWENLGRLLGRFFPPNFSDRTEILAALIETLRIAVIATLVAALVAIPLALGASQRLTPTWLRSAVLFVQAAIRTVPSLVWALFAVAVVGPNPVAGVIALVFYSLGYLGKFFADVIDSGHFEAAKSLLQNGAHPLQAFQYGLWPEIAPLLRRHLLWMFEYNIRSASIIGYVGAGGIGTQLHVYQEYGQWDRFSAVMLVILALVLVVESFSRWSGRRRA